MILEKENLSKFIIAMMNDEIDYRLIVNRLAKEQPELFLEYALDSLGIEKSDPEPASEPEKFYPDEFEKKKILDFVKEKNEGAAIDFLESVTSFTRKDCGTLIFFLSKYMDEPYSHRSQHILVDDQLNDVLQSLFYCIRG